MRRRSGARQARARGAPGDGPPHRARPDRRRPQSRVGAAGRRLRLRATNAGVSTVAGRRNGWQRRLADGRRGRRGRCPGASGTARRPVEAAAGRGGSPSGGGSAAERAGGDTLKVWAPRPKHRAGLTLMPLPTRHRRSIDAARPWRVRGGNVLGCRLARGVRAGGSEPAATGSGDADFFVVGRDWHRVEDVLDSAALRSVSRLAGSLGPGWTDAGACMRPPRRVEPSKCAPCCQLFRAPGLGSRNRSVGQRWPRAR